MIYDRESSLGQRISSKNCMHLVTNHTHQTRSETTRVQKKFSKFIQPSEFLLKYLSGVTPDMGVQHILVSETDDDY
jgi:hypothetical protein